MLRVKITSGYCYFSRARRQVTSAETNTRTQKGVQCSSNHRIATYFVEWEMQ